MSAAAWAGVVRLSVRRLAATPRQSAVLALCIAVTVFVPLAASTLLSRYRADLTARAQATPLIAGAEGSRFDLTLAALYFRQGFGDPVETVPLSFADLLDDRNAGLAIPINAQRTAQGAPLVGTITDYFEFRGLRPAAGTLPLMLGDCVLGANAAARLGVGVGDSVFSDQEGEFDLSKPPSLKMTVVGVLQPTGQPDDDAVFCSLGTIWIVEGLAHGHDDPETMPESQLIGRAGSHAVVSEQALQYNQVTDANAASFHVHASRDLLPVTAVVFVPQSEKSGTITSTWVNTLEGRQMVAPRAVIDDLLEVVLRIKSLFDALSVVLAATTAALVALVLGLSTRLRAAEIRTLRRVGCPPWFVPALLGVEFGLVILSGVVVAAALTGLTTLFFPSLI